MGSIVMEIFNPTTTSKEGKILISAYTLPEPKKQTRVIEMEGIDNTWNKVVYTKKYVDYLASKIIVPLKEEYKEEFISELYGCLPFGENVLINLEKGISIESLKSRIKIVGFHERFKIEPFAILTPLVKEEETQGELWDYVQDIIIDPTRDIGTKIAYLKTKLTIKRNK